MVSVSLGRGLGRRAKARTNSWAEIDTLRSAGVRRSRKNLAGLGNRQRAGRRLLRVFQAAGQDLIFIRHRQIFSWLARAPNITIARGCEVSPSKFSSALGPSTGTASNLVPRVLFQHEV